jgi:hypothetical protein
MSVLTMLFGTDSPASTSTLTEVDVYRQMIRDGAIPGFGSSAKKMPGYAAPAPIYITVDNKVNGAGEGQSSYPSIESAIQIQTQALADTHADQDWTDQQVSASLGRVAVDAMVWLGGLDPNSAHIGELVVKYIQVYRVAVTPV